MEEIEFVLVNVVFEEILKKVLKEEEIFLLDSIFFLLCFMEFFVVVFKEIEFVSFRDIILILLVVVEVFLMREVEGDLV